MNTAPQKTASITFTADEARVTLELIDVAVKTLGMKAAKAGVVISEKINAAFEEAPKLDVVPKVE